MSNIKRIFEKFEDINEFEGIDPRKKFGSREYREVEAYFNEKYGTERDKLLDMVNICLTAATEEAFLDGFCFGIKLFVECMIWESD